LVVFFVSNITHIQDIGDFGNSMITLSMMNTCLIVLYQRDAIWSIYFVQDDKLERTQSRTDTGLKGG